MLCGTLHLITSWNSILCIIIADIIVILVWNVPIYFFIKLRRDVILNMYFDKLGYSSEKTITCQMLVIKDNMPVAMTASQIIEFYAQKLTGIIKEELEYERGTLTEKLHVRTLERIFIEERIYKEIETKKTQEEVVKAVYKGFEPFKSELIRDITDEDVEHLLQIPIRRISLYDINKNREEVAAINKRLKEIAKLLKNLVGCAVDYLGTMLEKFNKISPQLLQRKTTVTSFSAVDVKSVAKSDQSLRYDEKGYLGINVSGGQEIKKVSPYDRIFVMRKSGMYSVCDVPQKMFVDKGMWFCEVAEKEIISRILFTVIFRDPQTKYCYIKRTRIPAWILNRDYFIAPEGMEVLHIDTREKFTFTLQYEKKPRVKVLQEEFKAQSFEEKGLKTQGIRLCTKEVESVKVEGTQMELFK